MPCVASQHDIKTVESAAVATQGLLQAVDKQKERQAEEMHNDNYQQHWMQTKVYQPLAITLCLCLPRVLRFSES